MSLIVDKLQHEEECVFFQKSYGILNSTQDIEILEVPDLHLSLIVDKYPT